MGSKSGDQPMYTHPILQREQDSMVEEQILHFYVRYTNSKTQPPGARALIVYIQMFKDIFIASKCITILEALNIGDGNQGCVQQS